MSRVSRQESARGLTLIELLVVAAVIGLMVAIALPSWATIRRERALRNATSEIRAVFHLARSRAIARGANSGLKFSRIDGEWMYAIYDDGDGDGVRNDDILKGIDRRFLAPRPVLKSIGLARIGLPATPIPDPDTKKPMPATASPIRFGTSTLCSFSPNGSSSSGSIFLTWGEGSAAMVRVYGPTARIRALRYRRDLGGWEK
ncbi:MAG TPA: prepilin-type N-terminal cleavage/methylation domain-containing protein [Thermoanaerobaculia bacterium]|nr:prepilin-type N-terminal cleavage/methylation domain-containing protein [Thermoanaerobaculia bacterium]